MRIYKKGEVVLNPDNKLVTIQSATTTAHPSTPGKVKATYQVTDSKGNESTLRDQDVRHPPKSEAKTSKKR